MHPFFRWPCKECFLKSLPHKEAWWYSEGSHSVNHYAIFLSSLLQLGHPWLRRTVSLLPSSNGQVWLSGKFLLTEKWETLMPCEHEERREWIPPPQPWGSQQWLGRLYFLWACRWTLVPVSPVGNFHWLCPELQLQRVIWGFLFITELSRTEQVTGTRLEVMLLSCCSGSPPCWLAWVSRP